MIVFRENGTGGARSWLQGTAALIVCCLLTVSNSAHARAIAGCFINASNGIDVGDGTFSDSTDPGDFPVDLSVPIWQQTPYINPLLPWGAWCYANEEGRVRGSVVTGRSGESPVEAHVIVQWARDFVRDSTAPMPDFTVNRSHLLIISDPINLGGSLAELLSAEMQFRVHLNEHIVFEHRSRITGVPGQASFTFEETTNGDRAILSLDGEWMHPASIGTEPDVSDGYAIYILPRYHQEINLAAYGIADGETYQIAYTIETSASETVLAESRAEAYLGDPLDADTGFVLNVADPVSPASANRCETLPDPGRYTNNGDGTATDTRTGLMWQRCPAGYALDDAGTADTSDDRCVDTGSGTALLDWQAALQTATGMPGYDDWRTPNVKELESLLENGCTFAPHIDPLAFPGIPGAGYWSATPEPSSSASPRRAWQLNLGSGDVSPVARDAQAYLLAVRHSGEQPVAPTVAVTAGDAELTEGDAGQRVLSLPVALSHATTLPVTVDYLVRGLSATDGVDFASTLGTLTIAAGDTRGQVDVQVIGDTDVEGNELVQLELSNVSAPAWLRRDTGNGTIIDDEPIVIPVTALDVTEADADSVLDVTVNLDRPAQTTLSVDYATADITATDGADYSATNGTLVFQPGDSAAVIPVTIRGDLVEETSEQFGINFSNANGTTIVGDSMTLLVTITDNDGPGTYAALNDTGVTQCANGTQALLACPQTGYPGQDAEFGRDVTSNDDADGALGFSFIKKDATGTALINQAALYSQEPWDCVEDQVTALYWEAKSDEAADLRYFDHTFSWYNSSGSNDGGDAGTANGGICAAGQSCDTESYVAAVNAAGLCGYSDWRVPSAEELFSIAWLSADSFSGLDTRYFPNHFTPGDGRGYWSATPVADDAASALRVRMDASVSQSTSIVPSVKSATQRIRLVRGGVPLAQP